MIREIKYTRSILQFKEFLKSCKLYNGNGGLDYTLIKKYHYLYHYDGDEQYELKIYYTSLIGALREFCLENLIHLGKELLCDLLIQHYIDTTIYDISDLKIYCLHDDVYEEIIRKNI